jgi:hypothetical protein
VGHHLVHDLEVHHLVHDLEVHHLVHDLEVRRQVHDLGGQHLDREKEQLQGHLHRQTVRHILNN